MEHLWSKEIQVCSNEVPRVMFGPTQGLKLLHSNTWKMLKKSSSQESLGQFQPNLVGNMLGDGDSDLFK